jgi:acetyl esterase/lipase
MRIAALAALATTALFAQSKEPRPLEFRDITYLTASGTEQKLDVYQNPSAGLSPVIVYFHGGAWWKGERAKSAGSFRSFTDMGFSAVSVDYRLAGVAPAPAGVQDARCALAWVAANAAKYHFDVNRIVAYGTSAGGHLALIAGMLPSPNEIDLPQCGEVPRVAAVLDFYGIGDVSLWLGKEHTSKEALAWLGPESGRASMGKKMSPVTYLRTGLPPVFMAHGDADPVVPASQSVNLHEALDRLHVPNRLHIVPGGLHGGFDAAQKGLLMCAVGDFLKQQKIVD